MARQRYRYAARTKADRRDNFITRWFCCSLLVLLAAAFVAIGIGAALSGQAGALIIILPFAGAFIFGAVEIWHDTE